MAALDRAIAEAEIAGDKYSAGAACLTMIGRYYGREYRMQTLRELSEVSRDGASLETEGRP